jgi:transposase
MNETITYVGLDVHKETIVVAADGGSRGDVRSFGQIVNTPAALSRLLTKLTQPGQMLKFCYEAGPCGYGIQRQLWNAGHDCVVVAPSLIPKKPGDRIKTDRRDARPCGRNSARIILRVSWRICCDLGFRPNRRLGSMSTRMDEEDWAHTLAVFR